MTGTRWTPEAVELLESVLPKHSNYREVRDAHFPHLSVGSVAAKGKRVAGDTAYIRNPDWTTGELKRLKQVIELARVTSWAKVAKHMPNRSVNSCKHAAYNHLTPYDDTKHFFKVDGLFIRRNGPPKPWVLKLGRIVKDKLDARNTTVKDFAEIVGVGRNQIDQLIRGHKTPRMIGYVKICTALDLDPGEVLSKALRASGKIKEDAAKGGKFNTRVEGG